MYKMVYTCDTFHIAIHWCMLFRLYIDGNASKPHISRKHKKMFQNKLDFCLLLLFLLFFINTC